MGAQPSQLWLLEEGDLRDMAAEAGGIMDASKGQSKEHLIDIIVRGQSHKNDFSSNAITSGEIVDLTDKMSPKKVKKRRFAADSVPQNLQALSENELRSICAAHGVKPAGHTKADIIEQIEDELYAEENLPMRSKKKSNLKFLS